MDCLDVQQLLSEIADGRAVPTDELAAARAHCDTCTECAAFERGLAVLSAAGGPKAPEGLVDAILLEVDQASHAANREAFADDTSLTPHPKTARDLRPSWWAPRLAVFATAAVVLVAALTITAIGFTGGFRQLLPKDATESVTSTDEEAADWMLGESAPVAEDSATTNAAAAAVPAYITVNGRVYVAADAPPIEAERSSLVTVAPVDGRSAEGTDAPLYAYSQDESTYSIMIEESGTWTAYEAVTRRFAGTVYQLTTRPDLAQGMWPDLPAEYPAPSASDGSPTFRFFGYDEDAVPIYIPAANTEVDGFAIAPGTAPDDPAAGNPNWTWWTPLP